MEFLEKQFTEAQNNKSRASLPASLMEKETTTSAQVNVMAKVNVVICCFSLSLSYVSTIYYAKITHPLKHYQMNFVGLENAYYITVESQISINFILVQCDANVQLVDVERNLAILSVVDSQKVCIKNAIDKEI